MEPLFLAKGNNNKILLSGSAQLEFDASRSVMVAAAGVSLYSSSLCTSQLQDNHSGAASQRGLGNCWAITWNLYL